MVLSIETSMFFIFLQCARSDKLLVINKISPSILDPLSVYYFCFYSISCSFLFHLVTRILHFVNQQLSRYSVMTSCYLLIISCYVWLLTCYFQLLPVTFGYLLAISSFVWLLLVTYLLLLVTSGYIWLLSRSTFQHKRQKFSDYCF